MSSLPGSMVASCRRPIPLTARTDLVVAIIDYQGVGYRVIKDPVGLKYHRLQEEQYRLLELIDGQRSLEELRNDLRREFPTLTLELTDVQHLITDLHKKGLLNSERPGRAVGLTKEYREERLKKIKGMFKSLMYLRLPGWDPETTLRWMYPFVRWMFRPWAVTTAMLFVVSAWVLLAVQFEIFYSRMPKFEQFFGWPNLLYMWLTLAGAKVIHEFGHGLSCKHFGGECHAMGMMLLVFSPCLYCDVTDSWMLKSKWQRIIIGGAGMYVEMILSAAALFTWWNTSPGLLNSLCLNIFFLTTVTTVIFNLNPLMRFDGYYMLADLLEIPNMRPKADKMVRHTFAWYCLGIEELPDPFMPQTGKFWFIIFSISAWIYRWVILVSITMFLYTVLKPYDLQSLGIMMAVISIGGVLMSMVMNVYQILSTPRAEPMSYIKASVTLSIVCLAIIGCLAIPLPLHVESAFLIEPQDGRDILTTNTGRLKTLYVEPGSKVREGDKLAVIEDIRKEDRLRSLGVKRDVQKMEVALYHALDDPAGERLAQQTLISIREELDDFDRQVRELTILATCDGTIIAPPYKPEPRIDSIENRLSAWHGTPLDARNANCFLEERTHLLSIAPNAQLEAVLFIDQGDRGDVKVGLPVELKFEHLPDRTYKGVIGEISDRPLVYVPDALSNKLGGELPTYTDSEGRERLDTTVYRATVLLDKDTNLLRTGMKGRSRFIVDRRTAGGWVWRYLTRTFHFRM
jgi:putative peptide zinc metalloprotease protein